MRSVRRWAMWTRCHRGEPADLRSAWPARTPPVRRPRTSARSRRRSHAAIVLLHCNSYLDGLWTDITRTFTMSELTEQNKRMFAAVFEAREAALDSVRPGATGRDVDTAARRVLQRHGFGSAFRHATGHGVGFSAIDHNAPPRLHPASDDVLANGMVFNVEPAVYVDGYGGLRHCDVVALVDGRAEVLTPFQTDMLVAA